MLTGLVWSGLVWRWSGLSSMAGLGRAGDQKITTSCQQPGSFHMLAGERPCQLARAVLKPASAFIRGHLMVTELQTAAEDDLGVHESCFLICI